MDLILAGIMVSLASMLALLGGMRIGRSPSSARRNLSQVAVVLLGAMYFSFFWDRPRQTQLLPHAGLILLGNWHAVMGSFFVGIYLTTPTVTRHRRLVLSTATLGLACYSIIAPVLGSVPPCRDAESGKLLVSQTTDWTCSPAAAASLLRLYGIDATESEMAELCLTRRGTHWLGLYRGLKLMTQSSQWEVLAEPWSVSAATTLGNSPAILSVNIDPDSLVGADHGFRKTAGHTVLALRSHLVLNEEPEAIVTVFDPSPYYGVETWGPALLNSVADGVILRLVPRDASTSPRLVRQRVAQAVISRQSLATLSN